ncbi:type VI protein secretion system component VasF [Amorphus suaedae]
MSDDFDCDRLATLRWRDPADHRLPNNPHVVEGNLRVALAAFARLGRDEQAEATVTIAPQPGDWSATVLDARELRRLARRHPASPARRLFAAVQRRQRTAMERFSDRLDPRPCDVRFRSAS